MMPTTTLTLEETILWLNGVMAGYVSEIPLETVHALAAFKTIERTVLNQARERLGMGILADKRDRVYWGKPTVLVADALVARKGGR